jgi:hypothetical protein
LKKGRVGKRLLLRPGEIPGIFPLHLLTYTKWGKISWQRQRPSWEKALKTPCFCCDLAQHFFEKGYETRRGSNGKTGCWASPEILFTGPQQSFLSGFPYRVSGSLRYHIKE